MARLRHLGFVGLLPFLVVCHAGPHAVPPGMTALAGPPVLYVSPDGSDASSGTSEDAPLRTLAEAAARAGAGTTVHLRAGTYPEALVTRRGGTADAPLIFKGEPGAVIDGSRLSGKAGSNQNQGLVELRHPHVRLEGLTITRAPNTGVLLSADHLTLQNCEISYSQRHGISTDTRHQGAEGAPLLRNLTIADSDVHHCVLQGTGYGQAISLIADGFVISGNRVHENRTEGIDLWLGASHGEVTENEVHDNRAPGIYVDGGSYLRIHRNRVHSNEKGGIGVSSEDRRYRTHDVWVFNNLVYDQKDGDGCFVWDPDTGVDRVLFAHNTLVNNKASFSFTGRDLSIEVINNLGYATGGSDTRDWSVGSRIVLQRNTWLSSLRGFVAPKQQDFRLKRGAVGVDAGMPLGPLSDDRGGRFALDSDFAKAPRPRGKAPDAGAYEAD